MEFLWKLELGRLELFPTPPNPQPTIRFYYQRTIPIQPQPSRDSVTYRRIDTLLLFSQKSLPFSHSTQCPCPFATIFQKIGFFVLMQKLFFEVELSPIPFAKHFPCQSVFFPIRGPRPILRRHPHPARQSGCASWLSLINPCSPPHTFNRTRKSAGRKCQLALAGIPYIFAACPEPRSRQP